MRFLEAFQLGQCLAFLHGCCQALVLVFGILRVFEGLHDVVKALDSILIVGQLHLYLANLEPQVTIGFASGGNRKRLEGLFIFRRHQITLAKGFVVLCRLLDPVFLEGLFQHPCTFDWGTTRQLNLSHVDELNRLVVQEALLVGSFRERVGGLLVAEFLVNTSKLDPVLRLGPVDQQDFKHVPNLGVLAKFPVC